MVTVLDWTTLKYKILGLDEFQVSSNHNHQIYQVLGLTQELKDKLDIDATAATSAKLANARRIALVGGITGDIIFDGSEDVKLTTVVDPQSHSHSISTIPNLQKILESKTDASREGTPYGIATLDYAGKIKAEQLPSYVDDVVEYSSVGVFPADGESKKIYVAKDSNDIYRWSGSTYIKISNSASLSDKAIQLLNAREIKLVGDVTGSVMFDGSDNVVMTTIVGDNSHFHSVNDISGLNNLLSAKVSSSEKGIANGIATLDGNGKVYPSQLPSYIDDIVEYISVDDFPITGEFGKLYVDTTKDDIYRWSGTRYVYINDSVSTADKANTLVTARKIALSGGATGEVLFNGSNDVVILVTVSDNSHKHVMNNITGLQAALDNKLSLDANAPTASKLINSRKINMIGDVTGSVSFDGSSDVTITTVVADDSHVHAINTVNGLQFALNDKIDVIKMGVANGVATLGTDGKVPAAQLPSYVDDVLEYSSRENFPALGETGKLFIALDKSAIYRWSGSAYIHISDAVSSADQATKLATARTISLSGDATGSISFDGSSNVNIDVTVTDNSHEHTINNIPGLQTALNGKLGSTAKATDSALLNGQNADYYLNFSNINNKPASYPASIHYHDRLYNVADSNSNYIALSSSNELELFNSNGIIQDLSLNYSGGVNSLKGPGGGTIWHSGNDGAGSGLDADLLDGLDSSQFIKVGSNQILDSTNPISVSGDTISIKLGNGTIYSVTTDDLDTNTWRPVQDNLTTASATDSLSANQGKVLKSMIDNLNTSTTSHNHDSQYLGINAKAVDSDKLDGLDSTQFLRSDTSNNLNGNITFNGIPTLTDQAHGIFWSAYDKEGITDYTDAAYIRHTTNSGGLTGSVLEISSQNDANDGINFITNTSANNVRINGNVIWHSGNDGIGSGLDADLLGGHDSTYYAPATHSHNGQYVQVNPDGDGYAIQYDDSNPKINGIQAGGIWRFGADGNYYNGIFESSIFNSINHINATKGYYVGSIDTSIGGNTLQVIDGNGNWVGNTIADSKLSTNLVNTVYNHNHNATYLGINAKAADSDKLDGLDSTDFVRATNGGSSINIWDTRTTLQSTDIGERGVRFDFKNGGLDGMTDPGYYTNMTVQSWSDQSGGDTHNLAFSSIGNMWYRSAAIGGTWGNWQKVWTSGNDGSGSGLDADLLDGVHGSSFIRGDVDSTISTTLTADKFISTNNGNGTNYRIGDDIWLGDINIANTMSIRGVQDASKGYIVFGNGDTTALGRTGAGHLTYGGNTVWHAGNDGLGSGLDADKLGGAFSSSYIRSDIVSEFSADTWLGFNGTTGSKRLVFRGVNGSAGEFAIWAKGESLVITEPEDNDKEWLRIDDDPSTEGKALKVGGYGVWHEGNDGPNSGLSADLVDGLHVGSAASTNIAHIPSVQSDGVMEIGRYVDFHHSMGNGADYNARLHTDGSSNGELFINGGKVWNANNDGSGSGLDADTLDGLHSSNFIRFYEQSNAPESAPNGSIWRDSDTNVLYISRNDGTTTVWLEV